MLQLPLNIQMNAGSRLENFYVGNNNQLLDSLQHINQSNKDFIYIWGSASVGKTHLAQAICQHYSDKNLSAAYIPLNNKGLSVEVLDGLELFDLVCLDSLESIKNSEQWQTAIFNLFNNLKNNQSKLILLSRFSAKNIPLELADLKSRLNSMEVYKLDALDDQQLLSFIILNAEERGLDIPIEVARFILLRESREIEYLLKMISILDVQSIAQQRKITIPFVKKVLAI